MAEGEGFEPSIRFTPYTRFPSVRLQPLGHPSVGAIISHSCRRAQVTLRTKYMPYETCCTELGDVIL